jgi:hypothetical protein
MASGTLDPPPRRNGRGMSAAAIRMFDGAIRLNKMNAAKAEDVELC